MVAALDFSPSFDDRLPPHNADAERAVIGSLLLDPPALDRVEGVLQPSDFYTPECRTIYRAALALRRDEKPCDLMQMTTLLHDKGALEKVGGKLVLTQLLDCVLSSANIDQYAALIVEKSRLRKLIAHGRKCLQLAHSGDEWQSIYNQAESGLYEIGGTDAADVQPLEAEMIDLLTEIESRSEGLILPGVRVGFDDLDAMTQGFQRGDLIITAGRPSMGKTAMLLQCLLAISMQGLPVVIFSMEMSARQLSYRLLSSQTGIEASRLRVGRLHSDSDWSSVSAGISRLAGLPFYIVDRANLTVADIRTKVRHLAAQHGALGMVGLDYLQLMGESSSNRVNELGQITRSLKQLAREIDCPINVLSQLSRGVESRTNKRPMMSDLRESGNIEQDSDLIMMLYREEYYDPETADRGLAEVILTKHRNGPTGTVKLLFEKEFTRFRNLASA